MLIWYCGRTNPLSIYATVNKTFVDGKFILMLKNKPKKDEMVKNRKKTELFKNALL